MPSLSTVIAGLAVLAVFVAIVARGIYNRRRGRGSCSCGGSCGSCPSAGLCHPAPNQNKTQQT